MSDTLLVYASRRTTLIKRISQTCDVKFWVPFTENSYKLSYIFTMLYCRTATIQASVYFNSTKRHCLFLLFILEDSVQSLVHERVD